MKQRERTADAADMPIDEATIAVLLVEDEPSISKVVGKLLDEAGYSHKTIADHDEIPAAVERWRPRCVILDSEPPANGQGRSWADAAAIRRAHPSLPVLMFTADDASIAEARAGTSARSKAAGFAGVMDKPFLVMEFLATLKHTVESPVDHDGAKNDVPPTATASADPVTVYPAVGGEATTEWVAADFFSTAVHELRTPLTSILGQAQFALRYVDRDPSRARDAIERTMAQAVRMNRLIGELLDTSRITVGALSLEVVTLDLGVAIAIAIPQYEHGDAPRITFESPADPVRVRGDLDRIAQIVGNLLDNALKYSQPTTPITVTLAVVGDEAHVSVEDQGVGIPSDEQDRIFAPFYRTARTRSLPGTGLGLHISRRLAEQHHGRLWLERSIDGGSVFVLALPLAG